MLRCMLNFSWLVSFPPFLLEEAGVDLDGLHLVVSLLIRNTLCWFLTVGSSVKEQATWSIHFDLLTIDPLVRSASWILS